MIRMHSIWCDLHVQSAKHFGGDEILKNMAARYRFAIDISLGYFGHVSGDFYDGCKRNSGGRLIFPSAF